MKSTQTIEGLANIINQYDVFILDQWGVLHDGIKGYIQAIKCVEKLHQEKKEIIIISNSSKRKETTIKKLPNLGFDPKYFMEVITSGEMIWQSLNNASYDFTKNLEKNCYHIYDQDKEDGKYFISGLEKFNFVTKNNPSIISIKKNGNNHKLNNKLRFSDKILIINPYPGLNYDIYNFNKFKPKAILHTLYHSGTASTRNDTKKNISLEKFIKQNKYRKIPFFISPISKKNKNIYASLKILLNLNVKCLDGITFETAYAKLGLAYKSFKNEKERNRFLVKNNFFEKISF